MSRTGHVGIQFRGGSLRTAFLIALASAALGGQAYAQQKTIAIIVPTLKITVLQTESAAAAKAAAKLGYKTILLTHDFNTTKELQDADQIVIEKVAGVAWNVADPASSNGAVQKVRNAGIPVVNMDRVLTLPKVASASFQSDNFQCGALAAQAFINLVGNSGTYAELPGPQSDEMGRTRSAGYHSVLDKTALKMVARQPANYDETRGFQLAGSILQAHPDIKGFVAGNDSIGLGAAAAIKSQNKSGMVVVGIDGGTDAASAIASGTSAFRASAAQPVVDMGEQAVVELDKLIQNTGGGVSPGSVKLIPCTLMEKK
jgi:erythritol transport system substrate-binding protein